MNRFVCTSLLAALLLPAGCNNNGGVRYPPPFYEKPELPAWSPPEPEGEEEPLANLADLEGEWVTDEEETEEGEAAESPEGGNPEPDEPTQGESPEGDSGESESGEQAPPKEPVGPAPGAGASDAPENAQK